MDALIRRTFEFSYRSDSSELLQVFGFVLENQISRTAIMPSMCCICLDVENMLRVEFVGDSHRAQRIGYLLGPRAGHSRAQISFVLHFLRDSHRAQVMGYSRAQRTGSSMGPRERILHGPKGLYPPGPKGGFLQGPGEESFRGPRDILRAVCE